MLITLIRRFFFGTPESEINYDRVENNYLRKKYYKLLRENKLLELKLKLNKNNTEEQQKCPDCGSGVLSNGRHLICANIFCGIKKPQ